MLRRKSKIVIILSLTLVLGLMFLTFLFRRELPSQVGEESSLSKLFSFGLKPAPIQEDAISKPLNKVNSKSFIVNEIPKDQIEMLPKMAELYPLSQKTTVIEKSKGQEVADNLLISGLPTRYPDGTLIWTGDKHQVILDETLSSLSVYRIPPAYTSTFPAKEVAFEKAEVFLRENNMLFPDLKIDSAKSAPVYIAPEEISRVPSAGRSFNAYQVVISRVTTFPTEYEGSVPPREILIDGDGEILSVVFIYQPIDMAGVRTTALRSFQEVLSTLSPTNRGKVALLEGDYTNAQIKNLYLEEVKVGYLESSSGFETLQPQYLINGTAVMEDGQNVSFLLSLPALGAN